MFIERRTNPKTNVIELWWCEWKTDSSGHAKKVQLSKISDEPPMLSPRDEAEVKTAICWSYGRTVGNVAVTSPTLLGSFPAGEGSDAIVPCEFIKAGKFRHGAERWWCRTHQTYWGTKADLQSYDESNEMRCSEHNTHMNYVVDPLAIDMNEYEEVGIWCSMPAAISTEVINPRPPKIHVHVRPKAGGPKKIDRDFQAISVLYNDDQQLFGNEEINRVNITPPAAFEFVKSLETDVETSCVNCGRCGYPHLDLGNFAVVPHAKHYCGNCGYDSTHSKGKIISTPLKPLHDQYAKTLKYEQPDRIINLDDYPGCTYSIWASTPAVVWTAARPQELGIHVHVHEGKRRIVDNTFGEVVLDGKVLQREALITRMIERTIV